MKQIVFAMSMLAAACGGKKDDGGGDKAGPSGKTVEGPKEPATPTGPLAEFGSPEDLLKKWQGAWVLEAGSLGHYEAWEVKGNQVTSFDGKKEQTREIVIESACSGKVVEKKAGGSSSTSFTYVFEGDKLHTGMGAAGVKKGDKILACGSGKAFVWDGKSCTAHDELFGRWESKPTECKLEGNTFTAKRPGPGDMSSTFLVEGDILMSEQMKGNKVEKAASFEEAKSKLATFKK